MRAAASAPPSSSRSARRSGSGASSSSARRRKRTAWSAAPRSPARRAAAARASNAQRSPAGPLASRWTAARSQRAGSRARARAAARCSCARSPAGVESSSACWMIGWTNRGGSAGCRSSAAISVSTASAVTARSRPATSAVSASDASSPRIASARATAPTAGGRRRSRADTKRATDGGPMAAIAPGSRLAGSTPRSPSAVMSCRASSGLPAVVRAHSAQIASPMSSPRRPRTSRATAAGLSGAGRSAARGSVEPRRAHPSRPSGPR